MTQSLKTIGDHLRRAALLGLLLALAGAALFPASAAQFETPALARIDLRNPSDLDMLQGWTVYAQLYTPSGSAYLLAPLTPTQSAALTRQGLAVRILDPDSRAADYYLLSAYQPEALQPAIEALPPIQVEGRQALVRATPSQVQRVSALGIEARRLSLHPLPAQRPANPLLPGDITPSPQIQAMIDQVTAAAVANYDGGLSGEWAVDIGGSPYLIATRYSRTDVPIAKATQYAFERLTSLGLDTIYHEYNLPSTGTRRNVIAEQPGLATPGRIFLLTAHLDSTSQDPYNLAPGADDNASGSTAVLIAAEILSQYNFDCTLRYALFTGEEQGLVGSQAYAADAASAQENIEGVLNLDMIGYNSNAAPVMELHTRPASPDDAAFAALFADVIAAYNLDLTPQIVADGESASDHASFWDYGYPGILAIEDYQDFTPYYHTTGDQLETLDLDYFTNMVKAAVGAFAHMGCLQDDPGTLRGQVSDADSGDLLTGALITATQSSHNQWGTSSALDGSYALELPGGLYEVTVALPGYQRYFNPAVQVSSAQTTTLDIPLAQCNPIQALDFTYAPSSPSAGEPVTFTSTVTVDGSASLAFAWNFGDGATATGAVVDHTYPISDVYTATLSAVNCAGMAQVSHALAVTGFAHIQVDKSSLEAATNPLGTAAHHVNIANTGWDVLEWSLAIDPVVDWLRTEPISGTLFPQESQTVQVDFDAPGALGVYTTTLEISSNDAQNPWVSIPVTLTVTEACVGLAGVGFSYAPANPLMGQVITFTATIEQGSLPVVYTWDFGDGSLPVNGEGLQEISHTYPPDSTERAYTASLRARNACSVVTLERKVWLTPWRVYLPTLAELPE